MLVLGDAHASDTARRETLLAIYRALEPEYVVQAGDLELYDPPAPTWFIAGNNEDLDVIEALRAGEEPPTRVTATLLASTAATVDGWRVAGLSGNYAPTKYDCTRTELEGDRRRHFTHEDVERAATLSDVDILVTHEAPTGLLSYGYDPGCEHIDGLLETLSPALCLVGHHHRHRETEIDGTRVVSLAPAWERYYTLEGDPDGFSLETTDHDCGPHTGAAGTRPQ
ncbi:metallophosphoesterase family protein [Natronorubrum bangense]|uniref:Metallophosphoesterase n=2 Tax=Natronorubrum bangense TaxID=61858 RepID=L9WSI1_9EURY|nr:metallophosphoesterase family protein [Natronorubrum bangense]ELY51273.1 metallophosphoesterase [Natronorubrum bangense JCM 10635]QCC54738.1 metallophosphoesterase [Natronorubrum bangense]